MKLKRYVQLSGLALLLLSGTALADKGVEARATFVVHCYDVGADALQDRPGVVSVKRGWLGFHEVDRVVYDPRAVDREQLEEWLKQAGTYVRTVDEPITGAERGD